MDRCKRIKKLLPTSNKSDVTSVRLSSKGEHAIYIDTEPTPCVKVCRVNNSQVIARCFLHCVPEFLEVIPAMNLIVVIGKDNKKLFMLALRDHDREYDYANRADRLALILGVKSDKDISKIELPEKVREALKESTKSGQIKHLTLNRRDTGVAVVNHAHINKKITRSSSCALV